jgi:hypothetical protein
MRQAESGERVHDMDVRCIFSSFTPVDLPFPPKPLLRTTVASASMYYMGV